MSTITLILEIAAIVVAIVALIQSRGNDLPAWGVLLIAAALILPRIG